MFATHTHTGDTQPKTNPNLDSYPRLATNTGVYTLLTCHTADEMRHFVNQRRRQLMGVSPVCSLGEISHSRLCQSTQNLRIQSGTHAGQHGAIDARARRRQNVKTEINGVSQHATPRTRHML